MTTKRSVTISMLLLTGSLILVNLLGAWYDARLDLTEDNRYTLSEATLDILENLEEPVTITAYFSQDLPPDIARTRKRFKELLVEYAKRSDGQVVYEFVDPLSGDGDKQKAQRKARQAGVRPIMTQVREANQMKQQKAYMGAVLRYGGKKEVIPFIRPNSPIEYELSSNIKKLSVDHKPGIAIAQGHGEPNLQRLRKAKSELSVLYNVRPFNLADSARIPNDIKTLAILAPSDTFPEQDLRKLDDFLKRGGNLFIGMNRVKGELRRAMGQSLSTGLGTWLKDKGIEVKDRFAIDAESGHVAVTRQAGGRRFRQNVKFPYIPIIKNFEEHPITKGVGEVAMEFVSDMAYNGDTAVHYRPLAYSSKYSGTREPPVRFNVQRNWQRSDFNESKLTVGAAFEGPLAQGSSNRLVVFGDGDFPVGSEERRREVKDAHVSLFVNAIDWLSDDTGLITLRTKGIESRPIKELETGTQNMVKYANFLFPIIFVVLFGIGRWQYRKAQRLKRQALNYG